MNSILIRAEDKNQWERRAPLTPADLKEVLIATKAQAYIQKSDKRFFPADDYTAAGAEQADNMQPGDIILGIKEIPEEKLLDNRTYMYFSHTIKGQADNMAMLKKIIDGSSTLIDYERVVDQKNRRLIYFGNFAGDAGAIDILWLMGQYWQRKGIESPFAQYKQAIHYHGVKEAKAHLTQIGAQIKNDGLAEAITPLVIGVLGYGNVSQGAQQVLECLPIERIEPGDLPGLIENKTADPHKVYLVVFKEQDLVQQKQNQPFDLQDYYDHPENYQSRFDQYLGYISILVNAIYWDNRYPSFVTWDALKKLSDTPAGLRLQGIADITCDIGGSIECNVKSTNPGTPAYLCDPNTKQVTDGYRGDGIVVLAVDNLPAEIPRDASTFFSNQLKNFVPSLINADFTKKLADSGLDPELQKAVIVYRGELTPDYEYLKQYLS
ncbi:MAG: hypothetical protein GY869_20165 [Planctomycetes bacterium]|nr:hypothetical protein [Planctomycetota bacterium]